MSNELTTPVFWDNKYVAKPRTRVGWLRRRCRRKFDALLGEFMDLPGKPIADILELGCAPGRMLERLHTVHPPHRLHGIDYSKVGIEQARGFLCDAGIEATIHEADIRTFRLPAPVDLAASFGLIEHFEDPVPILKDHSRFCRPGGHVAVTVPNFNTRLNRLLMRLFDQPAVEAHYLHVMDEAVIKQALQDAGLEDVRVGSCGGPRIYPGGDRRRAVSRAYRRAAVAWNFGAAISPIDAPWQYVIWGTGRVPA